MATNITAIGFIGKDIEIRKKIFYNGLVYTLGRALAYTSLALVIFFDANQSSVSGLFQKYGEKFIGPLLVIIGLFMLRVIKINFPIKGWFTNQYNQNKSKTYWDVLLLGIIFALSFCPYSGVLYFGMLIPLSIGSASGLYLPAVFAVATSIPVIVFAWLLAFAVAEVGGIYNKLKIFEIWFRWIISIIFIVVGIIYIFRVFIL